MLGVVVVHVVVVVVVVVVVIFVAVVVFFVFFFYGTERNETTSQVKSAPENPSPHVKVLANHIVHRRDVTCSSNRRAVLERRTCESFRLGASHHPSPTVPPSVSHRRLHNPWR